MMEPHSEHSGASVVITLNGNCCCGFGSVGRRVMLSPASLTAYSGPRNLAPIQRKMVGAFAATDRCGRKQWRQRALIDPEPV